MSILIPVLILGGMGLLFGLGLGFAALKFRVEGDPKVPLIRDVLPGANCGACGFAGCDAFAAAVAKGEGKPNGCPVGGGPVAAKIGAIMGVTVEAAEKKRAFVRCGGCDSKAAIRYDYEGLHDCQAVMQLAGGGLKSCVYGCLGVGSCKAACPFDAIDIVDGLAVVNAEKCTACGQCVKTCPKHLIALVPYSNEVHVACFSKDPGKLVRQNCKAGCIGCKICEKTCQFDAIHVKNNLASIDYSKCTQCGACVAKCPSKCIVIADKAGENALRIG